ncbi:FAD-dependent oxidoreductase [Gephyromycinifex aptenodytis]|uniref:FAD-dependent oxidoreductase n=1 Tax=Gephyromycinifex aptenodytis TaxID=2716227 RepID=UPI0014457390|nr:FAD-dependent oxidoreductase [Gephyromycinifex aptenodytis]
MTTAKQHGTSDHGAAGQRRRVAIVGAGPSGLYAAQELANQDQVPVEVDVYDRLPTPYGLLRYGVAPDHESIRGVATTLARVFESEHIRFLGLVDFGNDVAREELLAAYDAVIYAAGASEDLRMNVPGESLPGSRSAREFVAWYGGHPDARAQDLAGVRSVVAVGVGNVAVDVARILTKHPEDLESTDMPRQVLDELHRHTVADVWVIGRRGPQHASFTTKELRELLAVPDLAVTVNAGAFEGIEDADLDRRTRANVAALQAAATREVPQARTRLHFLFWRRPVAVTGEEQVSGMTVERTALDAAGGVTGTGEFSELPADLVLRAIGYRGVPLPGVPFDMEFGIIPNDEGRVLTEDGHRLRREYVVGWIKRGPIGVIGTNKSDAAQTVRHLCQELQEAPHDERASLDLDRHLAERGFRPSTFEDWRRIDEAEQSRGQGQGRDRSKIEAWQELLDLVTRERPGGPPTPADEHAQARPQEVGGPR